MKQRFIVAVDPLSKDQEKSFRDFITQGGGRWWHWIGNFWLLNFPETSDIDSTSIWNELTKLNPSARIYISKVTETDWMITDITNASGVRMGEWLERNWMDD